MHLIENEKHLLSYEKKKYLKKKKESLNQSFKTENEYLSYSHLTCSLKDYTDRVMQVKLVQLVKRIHN